MAYALVLSLAHVVAAQKMGGDASRVKGWPAGREGSDAESLTRLSNSWSVGSRQPLRPPVFSSGQRDDDENQSAVKSDGDRSQTRPVSRSSTAAPPMFESTMNREL